MKFSAETNTSRIRNSLSGGRLRTIGAGLLISGALAFGACGNGEDDTDAVGTTVTGTGSTVTTGVQTAQVEPTRSSGGSPTSTSPTTMPTGSPVSRATTTQDPSGDVDKIAAVLKEQFEDRDWYTAVTDVELDDSDLVVTVNSDVNQFTEAQIQEMCDDVSQVTFSQLLGDKIDALRVEDATGSEIAKATDANDCTVA